ncbi:hypothetical protein [Hymenobacter algoricola]|uniref:hypothetical protein n=1 Tax=Hymenobacter algoricola TaxID=486267 RepID=UPI0031E77805
MKLRYLPLLFLLLLTKPAAAQVFTIELPPVPALPASQFRVAKVVDARADRTMLGYVQQGLDNHRVPANFGQSLAAELQSFLGQQPADAAARPVVLRLHRLRLAEETRASSERANAEIMADFLLQENEHYYPLLSVGIGTESKGLDVTRQHAGNLAKLLTDCLGQLAALPATQRPAPDAAPLTWAQVQRGDGYQPYLFPIQKTREPKRGFYRTFQEFQNNSPGQDTKPFEMTQKPRPGKQWDGQPHIDALLLATTNGLRTSVRGVWGLSDGQTAYIFQRGSYFPLLPTAAGYTFTGFAPVDPNEALTGLVLGSMVGGIVGGAIGSAIAGGGHEPMEYEMSPTTGNLLALRAPDGFAAAADTAAVYLYRRVATSFGPPVQVLVDGKDAGTLGPEQYLALTWRDRRRDMTICLQDAQHTCHTFLPVFGTTTYLNYSQKKAGEQPALQLMPAKEGLFHLRHLKLRANHH